MRVVSLLNSGAHINTEDKHWVCYYCQGDKHVGWIEKRHVYTFHYALCTHVHVEPMLIVAM